MSKHIRTFESFQGKRRNQEVEKNEETINETVIQRDNTFIVGGVKVDKKTINAYAKKVKDQTGKDLKSMYSEMEIAEELVKWTVNSLDNIDNVPVSALMGGEEEMAQDIELQDETELDETGDLDMSDDSGEGDLDDLDMSDDSGDELDMSDDTEGEDTAGEEDLDMSDESGEEDEFEAPAEEEEEETEGEETEGEELEGEGEEEEDELPI